MVMQRVWRCIKQEDKGIKIDLYKLTDSYCKRHSTSYVLANNSTARVDLHHKRI